MELICQFLGYSGGLLLAICGGFEACRAVKSKEYIISIPFVVTWFTGEILTLIPLVVEKNEPYLILNYSMNIIFILVIIGRILYDRKRVCNINHEDYKTGIEASINYGFHNDHRIQCPKCNKYLEEDKSKQFRLCYRPERNGKNENR